MKISRKAEYALRAVLILAAASPGQPMQIQDLATRGDVSVKFLEQILLDLKRAGILQSKRGVGGGYMLDRPARTISVGQVIETIDGQLSSLSDASSAASAFPGAAGLSNCLREIDDHVNHTLCSQTLDVILAMSESSDHLAFDI